MKMSVKACPVHAHTLESGALPNHGPCKWLVMLHVTTDWISMADT